MGDNNVTLWYARTENDEIVTIYDDLSKYKKLTCPLCGSLVIPKAIKEDAKMSPHFAHLDKSKCTSEHMIHWWFKNKLIQKGDVFKVKKDDITEYICKSIVVEHAVETSNGTYKPDLTVITECGNQIYFEINYSNKKKVKDYVGMWIELGNTVIEVDVKKIMNSSVELVWNALYYDGVDFSKKEYRSLSKIEKFKIKIIEEDKNKVERLKNLDWAIKSIRNYSFDNQQDMFDILNILKSDYVDDYKFIIKILRQNKCVNILEDFKTYTFKIVSSELKNKIEDYGIDAETLSISMVNNKGVDVLICVHVNDYDIGYVFNCNEHEWASIIRCMKKDMSDADEVTMAKNEVDKFIDYINTDESLLTIKDERDGFLIECSRDSYHVSEIKVWCNYNNISKRCTIDVLQSDLGEAINTISKMCNKMIQEFEDSLRESILDPLAKQHITNIMDEIKDRYQENYLINLNMSFDDSRNIAKIWLSIDGHSTEYTINGIGLKLFTTYKKRSSDYEIIKQALIKDIERRKAYKQSVIAMQGEKIKFELVNEFKNKLNQTFKTECGAYDDELYLNGICVKFEDECMSVCNSEKYFNPDTYDYCLLDISDVDKVNMLEMIKSHATYFSKENYEDAITFMSKNELYVKSITKKALSDFEYDTLLEDVCGNVYVWCSQRDCKREDENIIGSSDAYVYATKIEPINIYEPVRLDILSGKTLAFTFNDRIKRCSPSDYDFVNGADRIYELSQIEYDKNKIYSIDEMKTLSDIRKEKIESELKDLLGMVENNVYGFKFSIDHTIDNHRKYRPWLIKDFIEELERVFTGLKVINIR